MNAELYKQAATLVINDIDRRLQRVSRPLAEPNEFLKEMEGIFTTASNARHLMFDTVFNEDDADEDLQKLINYLKREREKDEERFKDRSDT